MSHRPEQDNNAKTVTRSDPDRKWSGTSGHAADPTAMAGQYPPQGENKTLFGVPLPDGTGAPGSHGAASLPDDDPTTEPGQLTEKFSGLGPGVTADTGAPGTATVPLKESGSTPLSYSVHGPGISLQANVSADLDGPRDSTQANGHGYATGGPQLPGLSGNEPQPGEGRYQPGRPGTIMRGGRKVT